MPEHRLLLRSHLGVDFTRFENYVKHGGMTQARRAFARHDASDYLAPDAIVDEVKKAALRGRGGAGFAAGVKWGFLPKDRSKPRYLVINGDEGEPGTFKDRYFLEDDPFRLLEGCILTCKALGVHTCYIYIRGEFHKGIRRTAGAIDQLRAVGWLGKDIQKSGFDLEIWTHTGAGAYVCGEETALLESLEGNAGRPRLKPPFPAVVGLFGCPTIINNVETIANVPIITEMGGAAFLALGGPNNGGTKIFGVSGHVKRPGLFEIDLAKVTMRELIYDYAGGVLGDKPLKAVIPGGSSCPIMTPDEIDIALDFDSLKQVGTVFGTAGAIVMAEGTCLLKVLKRISRFYEHESCGQCTPCREGTGWIARIVDQIEAGNGRPEMIDLIWDAASAMEGNTICALADAAAWPVKSVIKKFRGEFDEHVRLGRCPHGPG